MYFTPEEIIVHHSATPDGRTFDWQAIRKYHMSYAYNGNIISAETAHQLKKEGKKVKPPWDDVGYHFGIELINSKYEIISGRMLGKPGAHCIENNMNKKSIGICVVGNFDKIPPPLEAWSLTASMVASLCHMFKIPFTKVKGHREYASYKSCPGSKWDMDKFRADLELV